LEILLLEKAQVRIYLAIKFGVRIFKGEEILKLRESACQAAVHRSVPSMRRLSTGLAFLFRTNAEPSVLSSNRADRFSLLGIQVIPISSSFGWLYLFVNCWGSCSQVIATKWRAVSGFVSRRHLVHSLVGQIDGQVAHPQTHARSTSGLPISYSLISGRATARGSKPVDQVY
jgi:hypothetical protein